MKVVYCFCSILLVVVLFGCCEETTNLQNGTGQGFALIPESSETFTATIQNKFSDEEPKFHFLYYSASAGIGGATRFRLLHQISIRIDCQM
jgi:hypothetical protein